MEQKSFSPNIYPLRNKKNNVVFVYDQYHKIFNYYRHSSNDLYKLIDINNILSCNICLSYTVVWVVILKYMCMYVLFEYKCMYLLMNRIMFGAMPNKTVYFHLLESDEERRRQGLTLSPQGPTLDVRI